MNDPERPETLAEIRARVSLPMFIASVFFALLCAPPTWWVRSWRAGWARVKAKKPHAS
jgi:hypothetical protein